MNKMVFVSFALLLMSVSSYAQAEITCPTNPNVCNTGYVNITEIKSWRTKIDVILTETHNCTGADTTRYHLLKNSNTRHDYALLLSAFTADMRVNLQFQCIEGYPKIRGVRVRKYR